MADCPDNDCGTFEFFCKIEEGIKCAMIEAVNSAIEHVALMWTEVPTPPVSGSDESPADIGTDLAPIETALSYVSWACLGIAVLSLIILGAYIATRMRAGEGLAAVGRVGLILLSVALISGAGSLVSFILPAGPQDSGNTVGFLQAQLWWYMAAAAVLSVIVGGARMAWEQRAQPGKETLKSLLTLTLVAGMGVTVVGLLTEAADSFSDRVIHDALACDDGSSGCFADKVLGMMAFNTLGLILVMVVGIIGVLVSLIQIVIMIARTAMLVLLCGILPLAASMTNTEMGQGWFKKCTSWLIAFILYKPAASIIYAAAIKLMSEPMFDGVDEFVKTLAGLMLMILAIFAMPALMRFVTPMVGGLAGGAAGGALAMGASALPMGAGPGSGGGDEGGSSSSEGGTPASGSTDTAGANSTQGATATGSEGAAASGGATSGGAAAAGGGAAAAAGPVGIAAAAGMEAAKKTGEATKAIANEAVGEEGGSSGGGGSEGGSGGGASGSGGGSSSGATGPSQNASTQNTASQDATNDELSDEGDGPVGSRK